MKLNAQTPKQSLNKAFLKQPVNRDDITLFKANLQTLLGKINDKESEEHHKNFIRDFLKDTFYKSDYEINTKGRQDLVIHIGKDASDKVGVILEAKKPTNKGDMISADNPNRKALHELVLYFLRERVDENNFDIKFLVITNINEWFIFDASVFNQLFFENKAFVKDYKEWRDKQKTTVKTDLFYNEIAKPYIETIEREILCTYFDIRDYETALNNADLKDDESLIELFKILSPQHLLKVPFADDSNKLDRNFYTELLHIIGLEETKDKGKLKIDRKAEERRDAGSLIENAVAIIETKDSLHKVKNLESYGATRDERLFGVALELCLTWINRVLFLKLLEAQLVDYHKGNRDYRFLNIQTIQDFDELFTLFHQVLAKTTDDRRESIKAKYARVPYLNSSLFEISELEGDTITIESLKDTIALPFNSASILKDGKQNGLPTLEYLFKFLDAYDFASEGAEGIKENNRSLINASVLGKIFEKVNNAKAGSIYTPGFITMYMCRQAIRLAVVQKFKDAYGWNISEFADIKNYLADRRGKADILEFNRLVNSLHLCDPAVGSGHFLVSSLNEIIAIKCELGILADADGGRFSDVEITIENDELIVFDTAKSEFFKYQITDGKPNSREAQRLQKTLFHEKQTLIENCLFGVDIIPHSVKICRLRLWIELLKNAYYKDNAETRTLVSVSDAKENALTDVRASAKNFTELETLPNIDINIKTGNSLVSRFALDEDLKEVLNAETRTSVSVSSNSALTNVRASAKKKNIVEQYRTAVADYKRERNRDKKRELLKIIAEIKGDFQTEIYKHHPKMVELARRERRLFEVNSPQLFDKYSDGERETLSGNLEKQISETKQEIEAIKSNVIYRNAFEWRFEFPEVLDNEGNFTGFDIVIGNPPYFSISKNQELKQVQGRYETFDSTGDIYCLFYEKGHQLSKQNGLLSYITSNKWLRSNYGENLRQYLLDKTNLLFLFDFAWYQVFDNAAVDSNILTFTNHSNTDSFYGTVAKPNFGISEFDKYVAENKQKLHFTGNDYWSIVDDKSTNLNKKLSDDGKTISEWNLQIYRGILTGLNEAFIIDEETKNELISKNSKNEQIIKPLLRGQDIRKFGFEFQNLWLINSHNGIREKKIPAINIEIDYPTIYKHLLNFEDKAIARADKGDHWSNVRNCAYVEEFQKEKLVWAETMRVHRTDENNFPRFGYDNQGFFTDKTVFIGIGSNIKYLLSILNSSAGKYLVKHYVDKLDSGGYMMQKSSIEKIPIKQIEEKDQQPFVALVDRILELKKAGKDTVPLENEIDRLVYRLYDLTDDEIRIVEGK